MNTLKVTSEAELKGRERSVIPSCKVYVNESILNEMVDDWFNENKIWSLEFKCKTWGQVMRKVNGIKNKIIREHVGDVGVKSTYSVKCGCSCGCSRGFKVSNVLPEFAYKQMFADFSFDDDVVKDVEEFLKQKTNDLKEELKGHNIS